MLAEPVTLAEAAQACGARLEGDPDRVVTATAPLAWAGPGDLTFFDGRQDGEQVGRSSAAGVLVPPDYDARAGGPDLLRADAPERALRTVAGLLWQRAHRPAAAVAPSASVHPLARHAPDVHVGERATVGAHARLGAGCAVHPGAVVGDGAVLGAGTVVQANAVLAPGVRIGAGCVIHAGAVIGFSPRPAAPAQLACYGGVLIEDGVEIGPNAVVEAGETAPTRIGRGAAIGAAVVIGHDSVVGPGARLVAMVGLAGRVRVGAEAVLFGQVGVTGGVEIGDRAVIGAKSGVNRDVPAGARWFGIPARPRVDRLEEG